VPREKTYPEVVLEILRKEGHRLTMARTRIAQILDQAEEPLNAYEILKRLQKEGTRVDVNTIYRVLETLHTCDLVVLTGLKGSDRYLAQRFSGPSVVVVKKDDVTLLSKSTCSEYQLKILELVKEEVGQYPKQVTLHI
jgi:Fe2+ or Zn2+ uptake regulation protein